MSDKLAVSLAEFYAEYPEFNTDEYKNICPQTFRRARCFFGASNRLKACAGVNAVYLLTAHLSVLTLNNRNGQNGSAGLAASAAVGEVSVSYTQIPSLDNWSYWLAQTSYGQELLALLENFSSVPFYIGGSLERVF